MTQGRQEDGDAREAAPAVRPEQQDTVDVAAVSPALPGRIGQYHVTRLIASGGMGTVYEAVQEHPRRTVAVKVLKRGIASRSAMRRFEYESQTLARLHHPGIAQVYEAGTHVDPEAPGEAVPFFAMEYIPNARPITQYAEERKLDTRQRLDLFVKVCEAVHHGHQKGIIHRDLKPGNILVDSGGQPRIIDFGVARATDSDLALTTLQTGVGQLIGTLQYMSPEQCEVDPRDIDARSDVYALGVVLYELLSGQLPYDVRAEPIFEAPRIIREEQPTPLSSISVTLRGEPEIIVSKALRKDRERRYETAGELASDIKRFLGGEPIEARRDRITYVLRTRARALSRRHLVSTFLGVIVVSTLVTQYAGGPLILRWTPTDTFLQRQMMKHIPMSGPGERFPDVRVIALTDDTDIEDLAKNEGLEEVTVGNVTSWRRLHGRLMKRLAGSGCRTVAWDIKFLRETPFDDVFVEGVEALRERGAEVVVGIPSWALDDEGFSELSRRIALSGVRPGCLIIAPDPACVPVFAQRGQAGPQASLALASVASYRHLGAEFDILLDESTDTAGLSFWIPASESGPRRWVGHERLPLTSGGEGAERESFKGAFAAEFGLAEEDIIGFHMFHVPPDEVLAASTIGYEDVFLADEQRLQDWFAGKVVVVGNGRTAAGDRHEITDGRALPAFYIHAAAIDTLLRGVFVVMPRAAGEWLLPVIGAVLGGLVEILARGRRQKRFLMIILLTVAFLGGSIVAYWKARYLFNPLIPMVAMLLASGLAWLVIRTTPVREGSRQKEIRR